MGPKRRKDVRQKFQMYMLSCHCITMKVIRCCMRTKSCHTELSWTATKRRDPKKFGCVGGFWTCRLLKRVKRWARLFLLLSSSSSSSWLNDERSRSLAGNYERQDSPTLQLSVSAQTGRTILTKVKSEASTTIEIWHRTIPMTCCIFFWNRSEGN